MKSLCLFFCLLLSSMSLVAQDDYSPEQLLENIREQISKQDAQKITDPLQNFRQKGTDAGILLYSYNSNTDPDILAPVIVTDNDQEMVLEQPDPDFQEYIRSLPHVTVIEEAIQKEQPKPE